MEPVIHCPFCRGPMRVLPESVGASVTCPHCRQQLTVPELSAVPPGPPPLPPEVRRKSSAPLIIVLVVLGGGVVIAGAMLPLFLKANDAAYRAHCMNNIRQIGLAMIQYAGDNDDAFMDLVDPAGTKVPTAGVIPTQPARSGFVVLMNEGYITTPRVFICPASGDRVDDLFPDDLKGASLAEMAETLGEKNCSYGWDPTKKHSADAVCAIIADKPQIVLSLDAAGVNSPNHSGEGQNVFYNDGHVKWAVTPQPDSGYDPDIYTGGEGYEVSNTDAKIIR